MKAGITIIILSVIFIYMSCSADNTPKKETSKPVVPSPNAPNAQDIQPDLHVSGTDNKHISGDVSTSVHISGQ